MMEKFINYYEILEINENASLEVIKAAYRALGKKYHPDVSRDLNLEASKEMVLINEAYEVLSDDKKRKEYDLKLKSSSNYTFYQKKSTEKTSNSYYESMNDEEMSQKEYDNTRAASWGRNVGKFFNAMGKEIINEMQYNSRRIENAYLDGMRMDEYSLVKKYKQSAGYRRVGYTKALEIRGLLVRNADNNLVPTEWFKYYDY